MSRCGGNVKRGFGFDAVGKVVRVGDTVWSPTSTRFVEGRVTGLTPKGFRVAGRLVLVPVYLVSKCKKGKK